MFENETLRNIADSLFGQPIDRSLKRLELLKALDSWISNGRFGTRRDFALHVRGDTKSISGAEWEWLENSLDLESYGINRHVPALWLRTPLVLKTPSGVLDLRAIPDCIGLTPKTVENIISIEGSVTSWMVVENRTSFEKVAERFGHENGVLWVPGFGPSWWADAVRKIVNQCPAPALVAADPDPAGINIAMGVGRIWEDVGLTWQPWCMDITSITSLKH